MDTVVEGPSDGRGHMQDLNIVDPSSWSSQNQELTNNPTLLYIAVEYVDNYKIEDAPPSIQAKQETFQEFDPHVSPLDPNMSSVARYSPVYNEPSAEYNPVVIHQIVPSDSTVQNDQYSDNLNAAAFQNMPTVLCNNDVGEQYLQMVDQTNTDIANATDASGIQLPQEGEQEVELLITDEATGISYSVNAQELLVDRCLTDDQQLLDPLLESDLLTLDESTLKSELHDDIDISANNSNAVDTNVVDSYIDSFSDGNIKDLGIPCGFKIETRKNRRVELDPEDQLLSCVYSITDKPILTRARASLPESYLVIGKEGDANAVFAKKTVPKSAQFGPLEGVLLLNCEVTAEVKEEAKNTLLYLVENNDIVYKMDVSDENTSNWMSFVRRAENFEEQNMVVTYEDNHIYFTTTKNIAPKQELKVGYSSSYAEYFDLPVLLPKEKRTWPCYECDSKFVSSEQLQNHLDTHDVDKDENTKPRKRAFKYRKRLFKQFKFEAVECNLCQGVFLEYNDTILKGHLKEKHQLATGSVQDHFGTVLQFWCENCNANFCSEALLRIHNLEHNPDACDEQLNHVCPTCQRKFPTQRQLVSHVMTHATPKCLTQKERTRCLVCYKIFAHPERLQRHMLVHGSEESKPLQCKTCNKRFLNNSALSCHVKTHYNGIKAFECPICKESFDHVLKLKAHVPKHCNNNTYTCPHCKKLFKKYSIIRKHIRAFHCDRTHVCPHCAKMFPTLDKLRMHMLRHSDHREFLCADCGKQFKRKDKLKEHCKRIHSEERENAMPNKGAAGVDGENSSKKNKKFTPKVEPTDFHRFIYKCHACLVGFKRRGMLVNHLAKRHPDIPPDSVPELNLPILQTTRDYYCQYCEKVYKSSSKRKAHILKNHPGAALPMRACGLPNPTFSQTVGSITTRPQNCQWCHKQYASKAKLLQHQRKKHPEQMEGDLGNCKEDEDGNLMDIGEVKLENAKNCSTEDFEKVSDNISNDLDELESDLYRLLTTNNGIMAPR